MVQQKKEILNSELVIVPSCMKDEEIIKSVEEIRSNNKIPIIQIIDIGTELSRDLLETGFTTDELYRMLVMQIKFENYEGAAFINYIIEDIIKIPQKLI